MLYRPGAQIPIVPAIEDSRLLTGAASHLFRIVELGLIDVGLVFEELESVLLGLLQARAFIGSSVGAVRVDEALPIGSGDLDAGEGELFGALCAEGKMSMPHN